MVLLITLIVMVLISLGLPADIRAHKAQSLGRQVRVKRTRRTLFIPANRW